MAQVVRVGVIGTGFGAQMAAAFRSTADCEVVESVTPRDDKAVAALCSRPDVDLISVHSPPFLHLEHVRHAIEAGHAVLCDKPFGVDADQAAQMLDLAQQSGVVNLLNFERRFDPARQRLRELVLDGAIGEPSHFQYARFIALPQPQPYGWLHQKALGGGWLGGQGSHLIDACRWMFGEVAEASCVMRTLMPQRADRDGVLHACDAETGFTAILRTISGVTAVIDAELESAVSTGEHTEVFGTSGALAITDAGVVRRTASGDAETFEVDTQGKTPLAVSMERYAAVVCEAVRSGAVADDTPTFADGLACARIMDRMRG